MVRHEHKVTLLGEKQRPCDAQRWNMEIASLVPACGLAGAMVGLVFAHDQKPLDQWSAPITLNALVSVLSVGIKGCLLFSTCEALGQWKWLLFGENRRFLIDFERVHRARRGPLGWANLLVRFWSKV